MTGLAHHHTLYIRCRRSELWAALTEAEQTQHWFLGTKVESSFEVGAVIRYLAHREGEGDAEVEAIHGTIHAAEPSHRLVCEFRFCDLDDPLTEQTELTWTLTDAAKATGVVRLDVDHRGFVADSPSWTRTSAGWPVILSSLKTWLETSTPLEITGA